MVLTCWSFLPSFAKGSYTKTYSIANNPTLNTLIIQSQYSKYLSYNSLLALSIIQDCLVLDPLGCGRGRVGSGVMGSLPPRHLAGCSPSPLLYQQLSITPSLTTLTTWWAGTLLCIFNLQTWSLFTGRRILANDYLIVLLDTFSQRTQLNENLDIPATSNSKLIVNHVIREYAHRASQRRQQWQQLEDHLKVEHGKLLDLHTHSERGERHFGDFNAISMPPRNLLTFDCTLVSCTVQSGLHCCTNQGCAQH